MPKKKTTVKQTSSKKKPVKKTARKKTTRKTALKSAAKKKQSNKKISEKEEVVTEISFKVKPNIWLAITCVLAALTVLILVLPGVLQPVASNVEDQVVQVVYLVDENCDKCYDVTINGLILSNMGLDVNESFLSINSAEGSNLVSKYNITQVPTFIVSPEAINNEYMSQIWLQVGTIESDGNLVFRGSEGFVQASYGERGNFIDLSNVTDYVSYKDLITNELEMPLTVDSCNANETIGLTMILVSQCPYCQMLETEILPNLVNDFGSSIVFEPHYLFYELGESVYTSMHGDEEYQENLRQICANEQGKWFEYTNCFNEGNDTEACVNSAGMNLTEFNECYNSVPVETINSDIDLSIDYSVQGTPTLIFDCSLFYVGNWTDYSLFKQDICSLFTEKPVTCNS